MSLDGRAMARELLEETRVRAARLPHAPRVVAIVSNETAATKSYLAIKGARAADAGCTFETRPIDAAWHDADAVIVQLPLAAGIDQKEICDRIPLSKDADVLSNAARAAFDEGQSGALLPPVVRAVEKILSAANVSAAGKRAVVVGAGFLVGAPVANWLRRQGATVTVLTSESQDLSALGEAEIIVSGAGSPSFIKPEMIPQGVVLIDAGTSESGGAVVGDADPACAQKCAVFTPVPGGVGPLAVACLFENVIALAERTMNS